MSAEFYIVFDDPAWYEQNQASVRSYINSLATFKNDIGDREYWLRGDEPGGNWDYGVRLIMRPKDILLEISSHTPSIVADIRKLSGLISANTSSRVIDEDGEIIDSYS